MAAVDLKDPFRSKAQPFSTLQDSKNHCHGFTRINVSQHGNHRMGNHVKLNMKYFIYYRSLLDG